MAIIKKEVIQTNNTVRIIQSKYGTYYLHYINLNGRRRRLSIGNNFETAKILREEFIKWLQIGNDPEGKIEQIKEERIVKNLTVREFFPLFMKQHGLLQSKKMQDSYKSSFNNVSRCPAIIDSPIGQLQKPVVINYMKLRMERDGVTAATVNREAAFLKGMLSRAVEWDYLKNNSLKGLRMFREAEKRDVLLSVEQAKALINELPEPVNFIAKFAVYSGFRKENILGLRIESLRFYDVKQDDFLVPEGEVELTIKGGRREKFPLSSHAIKVLKEVIGVRTEGYVFINPKTGTRYSCVHKTFDRAVRRLGLTVNGTKLRFHDLRHVFATWLHMKGVSLDFLRPLLGHRTRSTTDRYATLDRIAVGKVLELMPSLEESNKKMALISEKSRPLVSHKTDDWQEFGKNSF